jgi:hypothetical protein
MNALVHQRCLNHLSREAIVRCPQCQRFFCRECVTEHAGRMVCVTCVAELIQPLDKKTQGEARIAWIGASLGGLVIAWLIFYYLGSFLTHIPSDFYQLVPKS